MKFFREMDGDLEFSEKRLNVLNCFLDCKNMRKVEEVPNPLDPNAEVLEYTKDGKIKPKQPPSNAPKNDPIWDFFITRSAREGTLISLPSTKIMMSFQIHLMLTCVMLWLI